MIKLKKYIKGFTLVELIIVITILAILATIGFLSFQGYTKDARDGNRLSSLKEIQTGLELFYVKSGTYPMPEDMVTIYVSGITISYQGYFGDQNASIIRMNQAPKDPSDKNTYTYSLNKNKNVYQLLAFFEGGNQTSFITTTYAEYTNRNVKTIGKEVGILLDKNNNSLTGTGIDLKTNSGETFQLHTLSNSLTLSGNQIISMYTMLNKEISFLDDSLIGYWDMETLTTSGSLIVLKDLSQYGNNGTCYNSGDIVNCNGSEGGPKIVDGNAPTGKAMSFDGVDDWIIVPGKSDTGIINDMTFISKIKHSGAQEANNGGGWRIISLKGINGEIYSRIDDTLKGDGITPTPQGRLGILFGLILSGTVNELNGIPNSLAGLDTNYHIISNTKGNKIVNYLDGVKKTENNNTIGLMETKSSFYIGGANPNTANFSGEIEEVRIYNRSLSDQEILQQAKNAGLYR